MTSLELRQRALELAVDARQLNDAPGSIVAAAEKVLNFLEGIAREAAKEGLAAHDEAAAGQYEDAIHAATLALDYGRRALTRSAQPGELDK